MPDKATNPPEVAQAKAREIIEPMIPYIALAPVQFEAVADELTDERTREITDQLDAIIFYMVRLRTYLNYRREYIGDDSHRWAVNESNGKVNDVRKLLEYNPEPYLSY